MQGNRCYVILQSNRNIIIMAKLEIKMNNKNERKSMVISKFTTMTR